MYVYLVVIRGLDMVLIEFILDLGDIARAKFDFDVVGHYARPEVLSLIVKDDPATPVTFTSEKTEAS